MGTEHHYTIAIVDDSEADRYIYSRYLRSQIASLQVVELSDGEEAESYLFPSDASGDQPPPPHAMLIDINMPLLDGFSLVERLGERANAEQAPMPVMVMISSSDDRRDVERALSLPGVVDFMVKGESDAEQLTQRILGHLKAA